MVSSFGCLRPFTYHKKQHDCLMISCVPAAFLQMLPDYPSFRAASSRLVNHVSFHLWTNLFGSFSSEAALANQLIKIRQAPAGQSLYG